MRQDLKPKDIVTRASFENAIVTVMALGGSTNAVLHLIAMARAFDIELTIDDFQTVRTAAVFVDDDVCGISSFCLDGTLVANGCF